MPHLLFHHPHLKPYFTWPRLQDLQTQIPFRMLIQMVFHLSQVNLPSLPNSLLNATTTILFTPGGCNALLQLR